MQQNNQLYLMWQELDERIPLTEVAADACAAYARRFPADPTPNTILVPPGVVLAVSGMTVQPSPLVGKGVLYVGYVPPAMGQAPPVEEPEELVNPAEALQESLREESAAHTPHLSEVGQNAPADNNGTTTRKGFAAFCRPQISRRAG